MGMETLLVANNEKVSGKADVFDGATSLLQKVCMKWYSNFTFVVQ